MITRRSFLKGAAGLIAASAVTRRAGALSLPRSELGIVSTSLLAAFPAAARERATGLTPGLTPGLGAPRERTWDAYDFLDKCKSLGAAGIQTDLRGDMLRLRTRAEQLGMWVEGMVSVPRNGDGTAFERSLIDAKEAGATVVRTGLLGGRRYESFRTLDEWTNWVDQTHRAVKAVIPILERHKVTLAIENHKDWTLDELEPMLRSYSSEYIGVCFDFGNNIALLDDPVEMAEALAPYVRATHVKDMAVQPYGDGFLLSEVPLGTGLLDLHRIVTALRRANPKLRFSLEMITRDPLKVPCLTPQYWTVFPGRSGKYLAGTLKTVQDHRSKEPLPMVSGLAIEDRIRIEEENVKACLRYSLTG